MTKNQVILVIAGLILLGIVGGLVFKLFAPVPEIENTPIGTSAAFWAQTEDKAHDPLQKYWGWK